MKDIMKNIVNGFGRYLMQFSIHLAALLPILLMLDFGMGVQIHRDFGPVVIVGFVATLVFYAEVYSRYIHNDI